MSQEYIIAVAKYDVTVRSRLSYNIPLRKLIIKEGDIIEGFPVEDVYVETKRQSDQKTFVHRRVSFAIDHTGTINTYSRDFEYYSIKVKEKEIKK